MPNALEHPHRTDTLRYKVFVQRRVAQEEVRVSVEVAALVKTTERDQAALERRIHAALRDFVATEWFFSRIRRESDATGYERVTLHAAARIPAAENYDLFERCRRASTEGLTIQRPEVSYSLSRSRVDAITNELRTEIVALATAQAKAFSAQTGRVWRIGDIEFGIADLANRSDRTSKGGYRDEFEIAEMLNGLEVEDSSDGLAGAERIYILGSVCLKANAE